MVDGLTSIDSFFNSTGIIYYKLTNFVNKLSLILIQRSL